MQQLRPKSCVTPGSAWPRLPGEEESAASPFAPAGHWGCLSSPPQMEETLTVCKHLV